jgi:hypothetical protein
MARLGYAARILGDAGIGCDVNYTPSAGARDIFDDGEPLTDPAPWGSENVTSEQALRDGPR